MLRRWAQPVVGGLVYGAVWGGGLTLLGRTPPAAGLLLGLLSAAGWIGFSLLFNGPITRWRDRRIAEAEERTTDQGKGR